MLKYIEILHPMGPRYLEYIRNVYYYNTYLQQIMELFDFTKE